MKYIVSFGFVVCFLLYLCSCKNVKNAEFPFLIDYKRDTMPYFEVPLCDSDGNRFSDETVCLGIDTGAPKTFLNKNGIEYLFGSLDDYHSWCKNNNYDIENPHIFVTLQNICLDFGAYTFSPIFLCDENEESEIYDGIIGYDILKQVQSIIFDFKRNVLVIGGKKIKKNKLPLKMVSFETEKIQGDYFFIPVEINGKIYDAMLDTGARSKGIPAIAVMGNFDFSEEVSVKIGKVAYENVSALEDCGFDDKNLETYYKDYFVNTIILGNAFFKNHRIQLDFENMTFAMD